MSLAFALLAGVLLGPPAEQSGEQSGEQSDEQSDEQSGRDDEIAPVEIESAAPPPIAPRAEPPPPGIELAANEEPPLEDEDLEEYEDEKQVRTIVVDASVLGKASALDVFTYAGGRTVISSDEMRGRGATNLGEALNRSPGVRAVEGGSGIGRDTTLQVAVRGVNPRLSSRATVLLDEIPIAPAPYGQPQLSMFPLSLFSISSVDVVRGGATARYGPQTSGGVINLTSNPIPEHPSIAVFAQGDSNRDFSLGGAYGATHGRFGMYLEYAPRLGQSYRDHSDQVVHGGLAKFAWQFNPRMRLESLSHGYYENTELPGGLWPEDYEANPFQSLRPHDYFRGNRFGTALKFGWKISEQQDLKISAWYTRSFRTTYIADRPSPLEESFRERPRSYDVMGVEPRWTRLFTAANADFSHQLSLGARVGYELAQMYTFEEDVGGRLMSSDDDGRTVAYAGYAGEKLIFLGGNLTLDAGVRLEYIQVARRSNLERLVIQRDYWAPLPAASIWLSPIDELALFVAYGRSFGPPQYLQISVSPSAIQLRPELSNSVEVGAKLLDVAGLYAESTVWYKDFTDFIDVGEESFDTITEIYSWGVETEIEWYPSEIWDTYGEPSIYAGYGWTDSLVFGLAIDGHKMPWYPTHEAWAGASYAMDFGLTLGLDVSYSGRQFTDYQNREEPDLTGAVGPIPAYTLVNAWTRMQAPLPNGWRLEFTGGIKNIGDVRYFSRTDDRNAGILVGRPRTYYFSVGFVHDFLPKHLRTPRRKREKPGRGSSRGVARDLVGGPLGGLPT
jgi:Fe(3+) dicitrate transport protein